MKVVYIVSTHHYCMVQDDFAIHVPARYVLTVKKDHACYYIVANPLGKIRILYVQITCSLKVKV